MESRIKETALSHQAADEACGRDWECMCTKNKKLEEPGAMRGASKEEIDQLKSALGNCVVELEKCGYQGYIVTHARALINNE